MFSPNTTGASVVARLALWSFITAGSEGAPMSCVFPQPQLVSVIKQSEMKIIKQVQDFELKGIQQVITPGFLCGGVR